MQSRPGVWWALPPPMWAPPHRCGLDPRRRHSVHRCCCYCYDYYFVAHAGAGHFAPGAAPPAPQPPRPSPSAVRLPGVGGLVHSTCSGLCGRDFSSDASGKPAGLLPLPSLPLQIEPGPGGGGRDGREPSRRCGLAVSARKFISWEGHRRGRSPETGQKAWLQVAPGQVLCPLVGLSFLSFAMGMMMSVCAVEGSQRPSHTAGTAVHGAPPREGPRQAPRRALPSARRSQPRALHRPCSPSPPAETPFQNL